MIAGPTDGSGNTVATYSYDVFGAIRSQTGSNGNYWNFTGEQLDADSDLYFLRARYYDPATGRFLGRDPVPLVPGRPGANGAYSYVGGNPATWVDPSGMWCPKDPEDCDPTDEIEDAADEVGDVIDEVGDEVLDPALEFLTDPETLIVIGQTIGAAVIITTCGSVAAACVAGYVIYITVSAYEVGSADSYCEAYVDAVTSLGGLASGAAGYAVAVGDGAGNAIFCDTLDPPPVYAPSPDDDAPAGSGKESV